MILKLTNCFKGMSLLSFLFTLSIFSGIFLSINQWGDQQRKSAVNIYQRFQAVQIAENQKQRQFLGLSCEDKVMRNKLEFDVQCIGDSVRVRYPRGEINL